ncbi:MAG: DUF3842 family protein [Oscillospiraceae bacterium]|nr:DUF3842 family protein [Oscillospiraceae bacterium]
MKIVIIDGQGGSLGKTLVEKIKSRCNCTLYAIGTNSIATAAMLKAGADFGATGENPVVVNCRDADVIIGPVGIIAADSLLGEITPKMAAAIACSNAKKILVPVSKCKILIAGAPDLSFGEAVASAVDTLCSIIENR